MVRWRGVKRKVESWVKEEKRGKLREEREKVKAFSPLRFLFSPVHNCGMTGMASYEDTMNYVSCLKSNTVSD